MTGAGTDPVIGTPRGCGELLAPDRSGGEALSGESCFCRWEENRFGFALSPDCGCCCCSLEGIWERRSVPAEP